MGGYNLIWILESPALPPGWILGNAGARLELGRPGINLYNILGLGDSKMMVTQTEVGGVDTVRTM